MKIKTLLRRAVWQVNAIRHRDPLSPHLFTRLFGATRRRSWSPVTTPKRVLILRSDEIGDTVTTLTLLAAMRAHWPGAELHLVVKPGPASIFHAAPTVDRLFTWTPITEGSALKRQVLTAQQALRRFGLRGYDLAVLPRWDFDDTPLRYLAVASRARSVVGFAPVAEREPIWFGEQAQLLTDVISRGTVPLRTVGQLRRVARYLGVTWPDEHVVPVGNGLFDAADLRRATELAALPDETALILGVGIGARDAKRQWPVAEISATISALAQQRPVAVQVLGGEVDNVRATELVSALRGSGAAAVNLAGALTLSQSAAAISRCGLFLGNDSGLQHIASSLDVPTVVVTCHPATGSPWSDNAPERFGPWSSRSVVLQPDHPADGCFDECTATEPHCIRAVRADEAIEAIDRLLLGVPN